MSSSIKPHSQIGTRLRTELDRRSISIREFSEICSIPYRSAQAYLRGESLPGAEALSNIATGLRISLDWLVLGIGKSGIDGRSLDEGHPDTSKARDLDIHALWESEGERASSTLELGKHAKLARLGTTRQAWAVLEHLIEAIPEGRSLESLLSESLNQEDLISYLSLLIQAGLVEERSSHSEVRFHPTSDFAELAFRGTSEISQIGLESIRQVLQVIIPSVQEKTGRISLGIGRVQEGGSRKLANELVSIVKAKCKETLDEPSDEEVVVVIGVAKAQRPL